MLEEAQNAMRDEVRGMSRPSGGTEHGFALVLAILALMLLTFLGLTLAVTTSTELQIATNYRWSQQALYNAESGIELAKRYLQTVASWRAVLPLPQDSATIQGNSPAPFCGGGQPGPYGEPSRNCELSDCDTRGNVGYGVVLWDPTFAAPFQNFSTYFAAPLGGSFTLWVRRPLVTNAGGQFDENQDDNLLVLTAEGTAPASGISQFALSNRAVRYLEVTLQRIDPGDCENRSGQMGSGPTGSGFDQCDPVRSGGILGGGTEINPNQQ